MDLYNIIMHNSNSILIKISNMNNPSFLNQKTNLITLNEEMQKEIILSLLDNTNLKFDTFLSYENAFPNDVLLVKTTIADDSINISVLKNAVKISELKYIKL